MRFSDILYYIVGFNVVMNILQVSGVVNLGLSLTDYSAIFVSGVVIGLVGGLSGAALSTFFVPNAKTEKVVIYGALSPILVSFFATAYAPFHSLAGMVPRSGQIVSTLLLGGIELFIVIVMLFWLFQIVFGGGESYQ